MCKDYDVPFSAKDPNLWYSAEPSVSDCRCIGLHTTEVDGCEDSVGTSFGFVCICCCGFLFVFLLSDGS